MNQKKTIKWVALAFVIANLGLLIYVVLGGAAPKPIHVPSPNGVDDFAKAGAMIQGDFSNYKKLDHGQLANLVATNTEALKLLESGISKECLVTNDGTEAYLTNVIFPRLSQWKQCARLFTAVGRLAELEGRTNDAVNFYLAGVRFGEKCAHGGVFLEKLVGAACQELSRVELERLLPALNSAQCSQAAHILEQVDADEETDADVLANEADYAKRAGGICGQFAQLIMYKQMQPVRDRTLSKLHTCAIHRRQLMLKFAARAYELEKGKRPAKAAALVPEYLKKVPQDPDTGKELNLQNN